MKATFVPALAHHRLCCDIQEITTPLASSTTRKSHTQHTMERNKITICRHTKKKKECSTVVFPVHGNLRSFVLNPYQKGLLRFGSTCIGSKDCCCIVLQKGLRQGPPHCPVIVRMKLVPVRGLQQVVQSVPVLIHEVRKYACAVAFQSSLSHFMLQILSCFRQMHKVFFSCFFFPETCQGTKNLYYLISPRSS